MIDLVLNRHQARILTLKIIFAGQNNNDLDEEMLINNILDGDIFSEEDHVYFMKIISDIKNKQDLIKSYIEQNLNASWQLDRLAKIDLAILYMGTYEMFFTDTPHEIVINESLELSKEFADDTSKKFINGTLSSIYNNANKEDLSKE